MLRARATRPSALPQGGGVDGCRFLDFLRRASDFWGEDRWCLGQFRNRLEMDNDDDQDGVPRLVMFSDGT